MDQTKPFSYVVFQKEQAEWSIHNFGKQHSWQLLSGMTEEICELLEAERRAIGPTTIDDIKDAIGDVMIYASGFCSAMSFDLAPLVLESTNVGMGEHDWEAHLLNSLGKLNHAHLKKDQGIRGTPAEHDAAMKEHLTVVFSALSHAASGYDWTLADCTSETWNGIVKKRDWKANAVTGQAP